MDQAISDIQLFRGKKYALVSHAHKDHFSGYMELFKQKCYHIFEEAYIPPLIGMSSCNFCFSKLNSPQGIDELHNKIKTYIAIYSSLKKNSITKELISNWFYLLPVMNFLSRKVLQVSCKDRILNKNATVLWPVFANSAKDHINVDTNGLDSKIIIEKSNDNVEYVHKVTLDFDDDEKMLINEYANQVLDIYMSILGRENIDGNEGSDDENVAQDYVDQIQEILSNIDANLSVRIPFGKKVYFCSVINNEDDNYGLVFQYDDASAIYLCDMHGDYISQLVAVMQKNNLLKPDYKLLKSSHHGTRYDVSLASLNNQQVVHCCGVGISRGKNAHKGHDIGYSKGIQNTFCMDWDKAAAQTKWDPNVLQSSTLVYPQPTKKFRI